MIALTVVAMGIAANAASYTWKATTGYLYDGADTPAKVTSGTAYLLFASSLTQSDLVAAFAADAATAATTVSGKAVSTGSIGSNARIVETAFTVDVTTDQTAYFVVFNGDNMYISGETTVAYTAVGEENIAFASMTSSSKTMLDASAGYSAAGWYGAATIPEPTSGLLLLVGIAGLELRRRRA